MSYHPSFNPQWPALLCYEQGADITLLSSAAELEGHPLWAGCRLIDHQARVYILSQASDASLYWQAQAELVSLPKLNDELKHYAATLGVCCTTKLVVRDLAQAYALVAWLDQQ